MQALVIAGVVLTILGLAGLIWCIVLALRAKRSGGSEEAIRAQLQKVVLLNLGAVGLSALGLGCVVFGVMLS